MPLRHKSHRKKLPMAPARVRIIIGNLKRENAFLLKSLNELAGHHNDHNRIIEKFLALMPFRPSSQEYEASATNSMPALMLEEQRNHEENCSDDLNTKRLSFYANEIEEIKDELVSMAARCQYLANSTAKEQECAVDVQDNNAIITELQNNLNDAIEKNKQWMDYDQQRETYVKSILTRMSWLERHLREVSEARVSERNEFLSDEKRKIQQVENYYGGLMQKASEELNILQEQVCLVQHALTKAQRECREKQSEVDQLRQQLEHDRDAQSSPPVTEDGEEYLNIEAVDLHMRLSKERRKSATLELQSGHLQKYFVNHYHKAQRQMAKFKRMVEILVQDLSEEKENCSYLKQQLELVHMQTEAKEGTEKADQSDLPPLPPKTSHRLSPHKSLLEESFMECPMCRTIYPASQYQELIEHLDYCQN